MGMSDSDRRKRAAKTGATGKNAYQNAINAANKANELRYQQMMQIYDKVIAQYSPGGDFGKGALSLYESGKSRAMSEGMQSLVDSGLSNTTISAGLPIKYEEEVGTPFRLQLEDLRMSRLSEAQVGKAGAIERRQDIAPDPALMAKLYEGAAADPNRVSSSFSSGRNYSGFMTDLSSSGPSSSRRTTSSDTSSIRQMGTSGGSGGFFSGSPFNVGSTTKKSGSSPSIMTNSPPSLFMPNYQPQGTTTAQMQPANPPMANYQWKTGGTKQYPTVFGSDW